MAGPPVAPREWAVAGAAALVLAFTAWGYGGVIAWSLHTMLGGAALVFLLSVAPLPKRWNGRDGEHDNRKNLLRLLKFPVFWFSALFLVYITIQGLNPAWEQQRNADGWWMEKVAHIEWLPSGADTDYEPMNAFRVLAHFGAAFLLVWGLWTGVRRRNAVLLVLWTFVISGVVMALTAIVQKFTGATEVLWSIPSENQHFWGSFFYRNQAGAYLVVVMAACAFLYFFHYNRAEERAASGGPHMLLFLFVAAVATSVGLALSRGGILFCGTVAVLFLVAAVARRIVALGTRSSLLVSVIASVLLVGGAATALQYIDVRAIKERFGDIGETIETADQTTRMIATEATLEMAGDRLWYGWGAGAWRYVFPMYQKSYPEIYYARYHPRRGWIGRRFYRYAHNDIAQFLAEYGVVGCSLLVLAFGYWVFSLLFRSSGNAMAAVMLLLGMTAAFGHAFVEFIFQSPSYWVAFNGLLCCGAKLLALHHERTRFV